MTVATVPSVEPTPHKRRFGVTPVVELAVLAIAATCAAITYFTVTGDGASQRLLTPPIVALLLVANLLPGVALLVLIGRRFAKARSARAGMGSDGGLHVRLVGIFSVLAAVPVLLVTLFASLLFQYGVEFWFSDRARGMLENASSLAQENYSWEISRVNRETVTMRGDLLSYLQSMPIDGKTFAEGLAYQLYRRELSEALVVQVTPNNEVQSIVLVNPYERDDLKNVIAPDMVAELDSGKEAVELRSPDRIGVLTYLDKPNRIYIYAARVFEEALGAQMQRAQAIQSDYSSLRLRSRSLQLQFNGALLALSLLIVGVAVWVAIAVADRLVRPISELVDAAQNVAGGDLAVRVPEPKAKDEIGTLARVFNAMTGRLETQRNDLVTANAQLDSRRALIEAVMSGVSAGVISIGADRKVRLINSPARALLRKGEEDPVGQPFHHVAPELNAMLDDETRERVVQVMAGGEALTLAVKITRDEGGFVFTFDDITQQLNDQRRAAWSDVARRIAHEIKNPLTPIQLAAERLQRRYGKKIESDDGTFAKLTATIVRQVGDLRRMVDEFSSFARMPKPLFRNESLLDIARQSMFLHEVAHPAIAFNMVASDHLPSIICDRRQIGQAFTNVIKNAIEAIEPREEVDADFKGEVRFSLRPDADGKRILVEVCDNGIGLPVERDRIVEPYMTTRSRGTGLGLAIVKKIVEEHCGTITFADRTGGGTVVSIAFDLEMLATMISNPEEGSAEPRPTALTRSGKPNT